MIAAAGFYRPDASIKSIKTLIDCCLSTKLM